MSDPLRDPRPFVPALGRPAWTGAYDRVIAAMTRERRWRAGLLALVAPGPGDVIVDVGCGTGSFAIMVKRSCPAARVVGVDPDEAVLAVARRKAQAAAVAIEWRRAMGDELPAVLGAARATAAVTSLVLHQCALPEKRAILAAMYGALGSGGRLCVADYGAQRTFLMRLLFRPVQWLDGVANTQPTADGVLPALIAEAGFAAVSEHATVQTATGAIALYSGRKA